MTTMVVRGFTFGDAAGDELFELSDREAHASADAHRDELLVPDELVHGRSADREDRRGMGDIDEERTRQVVPGLVVGDGRWFRHARVKAPERTVRDMGKRTRIEHDLDQGADTIG